MLPSLLCTGTPSLRHGNSHHLLLHSSAVAQRGARDREKGMADAPIARLRAKARVILTSIQGLVVQAQTTLDRGEVLAQFATLQSQFDELRNDIATSRVLQYFAFVPGEDPGPAAGEIPNLFSVRETPAMEAQAAEEAQLPPTNLSASRIHDHNRLVDDVVQLLAERPKRGEKRRRANDGTSSAPTEEVATAWPENL